jgi:hypothetical protein
MYDPRKDVKILFSGTSALRDQLMPREPGRWFPDLKLRAKLREPVSQVHNPLRGTVHLGLVLGLA